MKVDVEKSYIGRNKNGRLCKTCKYRESTIGRYKNRCDYIEIARKRRGCKVEDCDKYEKGARIPIKISLF